MYDHEKLADILKNVKGKFVLSYNDDEYIRTLYKDFKIKEVVRKNTLPANSNTKDYKELIIKNF